MLLLNFRLKRLVANCNEALQNGGIDSALQYCNLRAYPITDSLSLVHQASIKRVSTKVRNPRNKADELATFMVKGFGIDVSEGNSHYAQNLF
jgi:hypothetical protein